MREGIKHLNSLGRGFDPHPSHYESIEIGYLGILSAHDDTQQSGDKVHMGA